MRVERAHIPECPSSRHKGVECICDLLRTCREASRKPSKREDRRDDALEDE